MCMQHQQAQLAFLDSPTDTVSTLTPVRASVRFQKAKYKTHEFGSCPRTLCDKQTVLPVGLCDTVSNRRAQRGLWVLQRERVQSAVRRTGRAPVHGIYPHRSHALWLLGTAARTR